MILNAVGHTYVEDCVRVAPFAVSSDRAAVGRGYGDTGRWRKTHIWSVLLSVLKTPSRIAGGWSSPLLGGVFRCVLGDDCVEHVEQS